MYIYVKAIYVDEVFTKIYLAAIKQERKPQDKAAKIEKIEVI
jgi:hypothetical protein